MLINRLHDVPLELEFSTLSSQEVKGISFHRCILNSMNISYAKLSEIDFRSAQMNNITMINTIFKESKLIMVTSVNSNFEKCKFINTLILHSNFNKSIFVKCDFSRTIVDNTNFEKCDFRGANLCCKGFEKCSLKGAIYDETTIWLKNFDPQRYGAIKM